MNLELKSAAVNKDTQRDRVPPACVVLCGEGSDKRNTGPLTASSISDVTDRPSHWGHAACPHVPACVATGMCRLNEINLDSGPDF
uniref:Uncharacterized protein n=1 Tax=Knipowitschia caucasica TaxID=637954 RepID=A0AAV2IWT6_KNICA